MLIVLRYYVIHNNMLRQICGVKRDRSRGWRKVAIRITRHFSFNNRKS